MKTQKATPPLRNKPLSGDLANFDHPLVQTKVAELSAGCISDREKFLAFTEFVREKILFGFNRNALLTKATEVIEEGIGYCNTKTTLLAALCKAADIPVRIHFGQMNSIILKGLVWGLPPTVAHGYVEVELEGRWRPVDSYIMDRALCKAALRALEKENSRIGYGLALDSEPFSIHTCIDGEGFIQMGGLSGDFGIYEDVSGFVQSPHCKPSDLNNKGLSGVMYSLFYRSINNKIDKLRKEGR